MKWIKYKICTQGQGADGILTEKVVEWNETNEAIAQKEAHNGEYTIEDDGTEEITQPTQLDIIEAQVTYTAMMTDTLLEV